MKNKRVSFIAMKRAERALRRLERSMNMPQQAASSEMAMEASGDGNLASASKPMAQQSAAVNVKGEESKTTFMITNLPADVNKTAMFKMLDGQGLEGLYDFVHVPIDMRTGCAQGSATVNMISPVVADLAMRLLSSFEGWGTPLEVHWCEHQGSDTLEKIFRDVGLMYEDLPGECRPAMPAACGSLKSRRSSHSTKEAMHL